jgi:adenosine deaminase
LSNVALKVFPDLASHSLKRLLDAGIVATINSDDPSYFGGYMNDNFIRTRHALGLSESNLRILARNGFEASFLPPADKARHLAALDAAWKAN